MVFAHVCDALVAPDQWQTPFGHAYVLARGITAPLFFLLSGWAVASATGPNFDAYRHFGPALSKRLRRVFVLLFWGVVLTLPWWAEGFPFRVRSELWQPSLAFGVLHCIAAAMLISHVLLWWSRSPRSYIALCVAVAVVMALGAPFIQSWAAGLPLWARGALNTGAFGGGFAILPWAGYFLLGCAFGTLARVSAFFSGHTALCLSGFALVSWVLRLPLAWAWFTFVPKAQWEPNPALFLQRLSIAVAVLAVLAVAGSRLNGIARALRIPSRHALTFYVGQMLIIWGVPGLAGLNDRLAGQLSWFECAETTAICLAAIWVTAAAAAYLRSARTGTATATAAPSASRA